MAFDFPKIDLHLHLDGSVLPETMWELAKVEGIEMPADDLRGFQDYLVESANCQNVNEYLERFELPLQLLQTPEALRLVTKELVLLLQSQGLVYAEIRFAPQLHTRRQMNQEEAVVAVLEGVKEAEPKTISIGILLCAMSFGDAQKNKEENLETVDLAAKYLGQGVVGIDLAGYEGMCPLADFSYIFEKADLHDLPRTVHAGDSAGPQSVWDALSFGTKRIGHGHRSIEDKALVQHLIDNDVTLEICPTSNIQCQTQPSYEAHPIKALYDLGVKVTVNTDNMVLANVDLAHEYRVIIETMGFTKADLIQLNINAAEASFMSPEKKLEVSRKLKDKLK